jgi:hypothetical protein
MNFGKWIVVAFVVFAGFIGTLVAVCMREDISLVSKDYYKDELAYQDQITRINNTEDLMRKPTLKIVESKFLEVKFNQDLPIEKATLKLFCPSNSAHDKTFELSGNNRQLVELTGIHNIMFKGKLLWKMNGKEFYTEEVINQ